MNLLKRLWTGIVNKTSVTATPVEVEEVEEQTCGELFNIICLEAGVSQRAIDKGKIVVLFEDWYVGPCTRTAVAASIDAFRAAHGIANAKLNSGKF